MKYITTIDGKEFQVEIIDDRHVSVDGKIVEVDFESVKSQPVFSLIVDGKSYEAYVYDGEEDLEVLLKGRLYHSRVEDERERRLRAAAGGSKAVSGTFHLKAPMPGLVVSLAVAEGQEVKEGDVLLILESMKMQNELKSPQDGVVGRIQVSAGDSVEQRQKMLSVE
ncbi:MAG: biotin/lipoyl-binding protein [Anaerolineae bacterium]|mgnify:CR=1 FL=1|jgi:biotin carboxyl carrier protein|nr:biotin/lipoyl-binding protein [Anaerolineae bacterium]MBT7074937.1 biotin/lipoyl-binding protein [Anaerolineae bacterium]MBT7781395.1 biotin/lipoyl-binding protein [Anaerolineae bacterium]